jgi:uncharacterized protein YjbJ (UPF0337 family)
MRELEMTVDTMAGKWNIIRDDVQRKWNRLSSADLDAAQGRMDKLVRLVQDRYGYSKQTARREVNRFLNQYGLSTPQAEEQANSLVASIRHSTQERPWVLIAGALLLAVVVVGLVFKPFTR